MSRTTDAIPKALFSEEEAAQYLDCSPHLLKLWRKQRVGPAVTRFLKKPGSRVHYKRTDLDDFIETLPMQTPRKRASQ